MHGIFTEIGSVMLVYAVLSVFSKEKGKGKKDKGKMDKGWGEAKGEKEKGRGGSRMGGLNPGPSERQLVIELVR